MSKFARIVDGTVVELLELPKGVKIEEAFHPDTAAQFVAVSGKVSEGHKFDGSKFSPPNEEPDMRGLLKYAASVALTPRARKPGKVKALKFGEITLTPEMIGQLAEAIAAHAAATETAQATATEAKARDVAAKIESGKIKSFAEIDKAFE